MNKQNPPNAIEWTRVYGRPGYTWNFMSGCFHGCRWSMPDGSKAICYAEAVAEGVAQAAYPEGFTHHYVHGKRLDEPKRVKEPAGIFLDSMGDLFGRWVKEDQIRQVFQVCNDTPQHIFFSLTKNPKRILEFRNDIPDNVWVGVSSPPDFMHQKELTEADKASYMEMALSTLYSLPAYITTWMSFEPLSRDWSVVVDHYSGALKWAIIGAASNGRVHIQPDSAHVQSLLTVLDYQHIPCFFKGNLRPSLGIAFDKWREEFPAIPTLTEQISLFE